MFCYHQN